MALAAIVAVVVPVKLVAEPLAAACYDGSHYYYHLEWDGGRA